MADGDDMPPLGLLKEHRVERDYLVDVSGVELEQPRHVLLHLQGDVAEGILGQVKHGKERAALVGVEPLEPTHFGELLRRELRVPRVAHAEPLRLDRGRLTGRALRRSCSRSRRSG